MTPRTVRVRIPPDTGYVPLLRTTVAGIAAREAFTLEEVDDLRMAVEEAAVLLLRIGDEEPLDLEVTVTEGSLEATLSAALSGGDRLDESSFSWMILSALADKVSADHDSDGVRIILAKARSSTHAND